LAVRGRKGRTKKKKNKKKKNLKKKKGGDHLFETVTKGAPQKQNPTAGDKKRTIKLGEKKNFAHGGGGGQK